MKLFKKENKWAETIAKGYIALYKDKSAFELAMFISERIEYYSDRWSYDGAKFKIIRILLNECEKRWMKEQKNSRK